MINSILGWFDLFFQGPYFGIILGWFLGLVTLPFARRFEKKSREKEVKSVLSHELRDILVRLSSSAVYLKSRYGTFDAHDLNWLKRVFKVVPDYNGLKEMQRLLGNAMNDDHFLTLINQAKDRPGIMFSKINMNILETHYDVLGFLDDEIIRDVVRINRELAMLNESYDQKNSYQMLTFNSSISHENFQILDMNIDVFNEGIGRDSIKLSTTIMELIERIGN